MKETHTKLSFKMLDERLHWLTKIWHSSVHPTTITTTTPII
jgi:hypothetical protein